jgi:hypothetical protein
VDIFLVWIRFPIPLLIFLFSDAFRENGNALESLHEVDLSFKKMSVMFMAYILVRVELKEGLVENVFMERGSWRLNKCWSMKVFPSYVVDSIYMSIWIWNEVFTIGKKDGLERNLERRLYMRIVKRRIH